MSSRHRSSVAQTSSSRLSGTQAVRNTAQLPPYQKPSYPLTQKAQIKLNSIHNATSITKLRDRHVKVQKDIEQSAGAINDALRERQERTKKRRIRLENQGEEDDESGEQELEELRRQVEEATRKLEAGMRNVIDGTVQIDRMQESLQWLRQHAAAEAQREYDTQMSQRQTQSQNRKRRSENNSDEEMDEEEDQDDEISSPGPTPLNVGAIALTGPTELYATRLQNKKDQYFTTSHLTRYADNNAYIGFKRMVHDAYYGDDGPPLPRKETWFNESGEPAPGITATQNRDDSDDDIAIERATISTKCPLTLLEFQNPVTSTICPHSFEEEAIMNMIRKSNSFLGSGPRRERTVQCPVPGCEQVRTSLLFSYLN